MGKFAILVVLLGFTALGACGDNIHPTPDAGRVVYPTPDTTVVPPYDDVLMEPCSDPEPVDTCDDKHTDLNGHEHKCQHHK